MMQSKLFPSFPNIRHQAKVILIYTVCVGLIGLLPLKLWAAEDDARQLFKEANQCYQDGKFNDALERYKKLESLGYQSGALYYNMGNTYYKLGAIGYAILYYERAAKLIGDDEDLIANLELARMRTKDRIQELSPFLLDAIVERWLGAFSLTGVAVATIVAFYLLMAIVIARLQKLPLNQTLMQVGFYVTLVITLFFAITFGAKSYHDAQRAEAIVVSPTLNLKSEPKDEAKTILTVHDGLKVSIMRQLDEWVEVRLPNGDKGWAKSTDIVQI